LALETFGSGAKAGHFTGLSDAIAGGIRMMPEDRKKAGFFPRGP
jgi:hypothetical protein